MKIRFLIDENLSPRLKMAVLHLSPHIDIIRVGDPDAPTLGTKDPEILQYLEWSQRALITDNRVSMPDHLDDHWKDGGHIGGLFWVRPTTAIGRLAQEIYLIWEASEAEEWIDQLAWLPL